jgi:cysteine-rich repeat protein
MHSRVTSPHSRPSTASMSALPPSGPSSKTGNAYGSSAFLARSNASIGRFCFGSLQKIRHCRGPSCLCPPHAQRMPELKRRADRRFSALVKSMIVAIILPELQPCDAREWNRHIVQPVCGDRRTEGREGCDDGNLDGGDGCANDCQPEYGFACDNFCSGWAPTM